MGRLFPLLLLADLALLVIALIGCLSCNASDIRALPRIVWVFLILLFPLVGPILWFVAGRPQSARVRKGGGTRTRGEAAAGAGRRRPLAPDDDPEFLRELAARQRSGDDEELLRRWEADLRRREEELRRRERGEQPPDPR